MKESEVSKKIRTNWATSSGGDFFRGKYVCQMVPYGFRRAPVIRLIQHIGLSWAWADHVLHDFSIGQFYGGRFGN